MTPIAWNDRIAELVTALDALPMEDRCAAQRETLTEALWATRLAALYANEPVLTHSDFSPDDADRIEANIRVKMSACGHIDPFEVKDTLYQAYQVVGGLLMVDEADAKDSKTVKMLDNLVRSFDWGRVNGGHPVWHEDVLPYSLPALDGLIANENEIKTDET